MKYRHTFVCCGPPKPGPSRGTAGGPVQCSFYRRVGDVKLLRWWLQDSEEDGLDDEGTGDEDDEDDAGNVDWLTYTIMCSLV